MKFPWNKNKALKPPPSNITARSPQPPSNITTGSYLIPSWEVTQKAKTEHNAATKKALEFRCERRFPIKNFSLRQLLAKDLGLRSWRTPPQSAEMRTVWINHELPQYQFIAITGVIQLSKNPKVSDIIVRMGSSGAITLGLHEIDELYSILPILKKLETYRADDELFSRFGKLEDIKMMAYFSEPYIFDEYTVVHITVESPEGNKTGDRLMLSGFVIEPTGMSIS